MPLWSNVTWASIDQDDPRSLDHIRNPYFNHNSVTSESDLLNDLVAESIQMAGLEFWYIKRELPNLDRIFGEDSTNKFTDYYKVNMYLQSYNGWQGQQDFYSKFGIAVNDEVDLIVQPTMFAHQTNGMHPRPGDLILWDRNSASGQPALFEIIWVEPDDPFHPNGTLPFRRISCQKFAYSREEMPLINQSINADPNGTDIPADILDELIQLDTHGDIDRPDYAENNQIQSEGDVLTVFDEDDPFKANY